MLTEKQLSEAGRSAERLALTQHPLDLDGTTLGVLRELCLSARSTNSNLRNAMRHKER